MLGFTAALSPMLCDPSSRREISAAPTTPFDPAIKQLDRDFQRHIRQEAQDQWRTLLWSSDRATNPLNISIVFDRKIHSSSKAGKLLEQIDHAMANRI